MTGWKQVWIAHDEAGVSRMKQMDRYLAVSCDLPHASDERLASVLDLFPVLGSSIDDGVNGQIATIYLELEMERELDRLGRALTEIGAVRISVTNAEAHDWIAAYRRQAQPFTVGERWWIDPDPACSAEPPEGRIRLAIEPSAAFGSGSHESTQLALLALQEVSMTGCSVLDVGTGSGILAVAAEALGAGAVFGLDLDAEAVWTARRVARQQGKAARPRLIVATVAALGDTRFDVVACNMMSSEFIPLLPDLARVLAPGGRMILSGALVSERTLVLGEVERVGLRVLQEQRLGEWIGWSIGHE
jgi:ribosomal protein L11 methyltransferase